MSNYYNLATITVNQTPLDWEGNKTRILLALEKIHLESPIQPDTFLFPELCLSGYGCEDAFFSPHVWDRAWDSLIQLAKDSQKIISKSVLIVGLPFYFEGAIYNCTAILSDGKVLALVPKTILANDGVHNELRWFKAFTQKKVHKFSFRGINLFFGHMAFQHRKTRFIIENCRDAWALDRPAYDLIDTNFDLVLHPSASCFSFDKHKVRRNILLESSRRLGVSFLMANVLGCEAGTLIYDGHLYACSDGQEIFENISFSKQDFVVAILQIDVNTNRIKRARLNPSQYFEFSEKKLNFSQNNTNAALTKNFILEIEDQSSKIKKIQKEILVLTPLQKYTYQGPPKEFSKFDQFLQAEMLGLFDTLRKSKSKGYMLPLSGGADSSTSAILVQRMLAYSINELGWEEALKRLGRTELAIKLKQKMNHKEFHLKEIVAELCPHFLHTVYLYTENNSQQTLQAAQKLSEALETTHSFMNVQNEYESYIENIENIFRKKLNFQEYDKPLQNIQARARAPLAWLLANINDFILLCTANRSEIAVGYTTMDGDSAGGLAPLGGVSKTFILDWLNYMEKTGDSLMGNIPELELVTSLKPSAELKPAQKDEDDLMPYPILDRIITLALGLRKDEKEILEILCLEIHDVEPKILQKNISRFMQLFHASQWKRKRLAPSFYLDDLSLDSSHFRFPILSQN